MNEKGWWGQGQQMTGEMSKCMTWFSSDRQLSPALMLTRNILPSVVSFWDDPGKGQAVRIQELNLRWLELIKGVGVKNQRNMGRGGVNNGRRVWQHSSGWIFNGAATGADLGSVIILNKHRVTREERGKKKQKGLVSGASCLVTLPLQSTLDS